jgi:acyl-CoA thioesterase II
VAAESRSGGGLDTLPPPLARMLELRRTATGFDGLSHFTDHGAIMGALQLLQYIVVAERWAGDGKRVLTLQTTFANGGRSGDPVQFVVDELQQGRSFCSLSITLRQGPLVISHATALLTADEADYLRRPERAVSVPESSTWPVVSGGLWPGRMAVEPATEPGRSRARVDYDAPEATSTLARALVAMASEAPIMGEFIALAGVPWQDGHRVAGNVMSHSLAFLEPIPLSPGLLIEAVAGYAGHGRIHGDGSVIDLDGQLLATFTTTGLLRARATSG